jgi:hypothetical protein
MLITHTLTPLTNISCTSYVYTSSYSCTSYSHITHLIRIIPHTYIPLHTSHVYTSYVYTSYVYTSYVYTSYVYTLYVYTSYYSLYTYSTSYVYLFRMPHIQPPEKKRLTTKYAELTPKKLKNPKQKRGLTQPFTASA